MSLRATSITVTAGYPLGRVGEPSEVAELIHFLTSDKASFITGGLYLIDSGLVAR